VSVTRAASTPVHRSTGALAAWVSGTQHLCREKKAAIARLGYVDITYGGIARVGLPAVKRILDRYLARLLGVLRSFTWRQQQLVTPPSLRVTMPVANQIDQQSQAATIRLRDDVARAKTAREFSDAFRAWIATLQRLVVRDNKLTQQMNLSACLSGSPPAQSQG
jgi:hypothetical protein